MLGLWHSSSLINFELTEKYARCDINHQNFNFTSATK